MIEFYNFTRDRDLVKVEPPWLLLRIQSKLCFFYCLLVFVFKKFVNRGFNMTWRRRNWPGGGACSAWSAVCGLFHWPFDEYACACCGSTGGRTGLARQRDASSSIFACSGNITNKLNMARINIATESNESLRAERERATATFTRGASQSNRIIFNTFEIGAEKLDYFSHADFKRGTDLSENASENPPKNQTA